MQRSLMGLFLLAITIGLLALAAASVRTTLEERWASDSKPRPARERVFAVSVILATQVTANPQIRAFGEVRSRRTLDLRAPISGTILEMSSSFVEGGRVNQGELLIRLDPADAQTALDLARTEMNEALSEQTEAQAALLLAGDELLAAREQVTLREAALERQRNLRARGVGTEAAVETAALAQASARQAVLGKRQAEATAAARVNRAATAAARQQIRLEEAERRLANTEIHAEFDGILSSVNVVQGGLVGTNEKIGRLIDPAALEVAFRVSTSQFARLVAVDQGVATGKVTVTLDLFGDNLLAEGVIERVSAEVGVGQTGRQIFARLPSESAAGFKPGDFVTVEVAEPPIENAVILPALALDAAGNVLVLGENDRLVEVKAEVLRKQGDQVILQGHTLVGREVIAARSPFLGAGIRVKPVRRNGAGAAEPDTAEMIELTEKRRETLLSFVENSKRIPADAKERIIARLKQTRVPAAMIARIEARMGG